MPELLFADIVLRIGVATLIGSLIGLERQAHGISAGLRTHALVCLGAAIFTIASIQITMIDPKASAAVIASGIVTGVGFLGAGAIFFDKKGPHGFTTAADIWVVAALGMMIGIGEIITAILACVFILLVLVVGKVFERKYLIRKKKRLGIF